MAAQQTTDHSKPLEPETDVVVIGAGIVGCASAYYLARRGLRVTLLEQGDTIGEQSRKNWGFVRQQGRDPAEVPLMMAANRIWREMEDELEADIEWTQGGNLALAATEDRLALFEQWLNVARDNELDSRLLTHREITDILPNVQGTWLGGLYTPSDGHADPSKTTDALLLAAERHGASLHANCAVERILMQGRNACGVSTTHGEIRAAHVVCAAGAWSSRLIKPLGISLPQRWVRATVARTTAAPPMISAGVWAPAVSFRQRRDGTFNLAAGGAADHDLTLESLLHMQLFLPNYWRNRHLFRFHLGQPF